MGPFDFDATARLDAIYTTNVEQERESEASAERKDFYFVLGLEMPGEAVVSPQTTISADAGMAIERHLNRPDLDNSANPFGHISAESSTDFSYLTLRTHAGIERTSTSAESLFVPGGGGKTRRESVATEYGAGALWTRDPFTLEYTYDFTSDRYVKEEFQEGDQDQTTLGFMAKVQLMQDADISYRNERMYNELVNETNSTARWKTTENIDVNWRLSLWRRPKVTYSFGLEKQDTNEEDGTWDTRHTLALDDEYEFSRALRLKYGAMYEVEGKKESTDISLTYNALVEQDLGRSVKHSLGVIREPVGTFGSTEDTDRTAWTYNFMKSDLFIYALNFGARVDYTIDKPLDPTVPEEKTTTYELRLDHSVDISRRLHRSLLYEYSWEKSDVNTEVLDEHRVTWRYEYDL